jgi:short-subunit dehydrogenase
MSVSLKPVREQVIVITGASSGIGLVTAQKAAAQGAKVVLASRDGGTLADVERQITAAGGQAAHVVADVSNQDDVRRIAETAIQRFGGFDTWVNNAGLSVFGRIDEGKIEDFRRLFDINFWGLVYGSLVAAEHLKQRGGALINLGSVASDNALPLQGMYSASKHAVKGFTDAFRMELEQEGAPISVTLIKPTSIDTPFPQHVKNNTEREMKLPPPVYPPEEVAAAVLHAAAHPERDIYVGGAARLMSTLGKQMPRTMDRLGESVLAGQQFRDEPPRDPEGTLYRAGSGGRVRGDHPGYVTQTSLYTRAAMHPLLTGGLAVAAGVALATLFKGGGEEDRGSRPRARAAAG